MESQEHPGSGSLAANSQPHHYEDGDILLRSGGDVESEVIMDLTSSPFSHSGICGSAESAEAVDAYPADEGKASKQTKGPYSRKKGREVAKLPISLFYSEEHAPGGGEVYRYKGAAEKRQMAAKWAMEQSRHSYFFDIMDPIVGVEGVPLDNNKLYCSEFVWSCFRHGANVVLVKSEDFLDLFSRARLAQTVQAIVPLAREQAGQVSKVAPDSVMEKLIDRRIKRSQHNGKFLAPGQLASSAHVTRVHSIPGKGSQEVARVREATPM
jgi:hypothetical protein